MGRSLKRRRMDEYMRDLRRLRALARDELRLDSGGQRKSASGPTAPAVKVRDPETQALIDAALRERGMAP